MMQRQMGVPKAFHPLPFKRRGFHGLKPKFCKGRRLKPLVRTRVFAAANEDPADALYRSVMTDMSENIRHWYSSQVCRME